MRLRNSLLALFLVLGAWQLTPAQSATYGFTPTIFDQFVTMRVGTGAPVYWYCIGEIYSYPEGKLMARVEGIDTARLLTSATQKGTKAEQVSRKIFVYRDPETFAVIKEKNGQKVEPIAYPYQYITYERKGDKLMATVEQGSGARKQRIESKGENRVRQFGKLTIVSSPLFLNFPTPRGKYEAYENYDFFLQPKGGKDAPQYQLTWNRFGDLPPAFGGGKSVFQLVSYRIDKYADLPQTMRDYLETEGRLWMKPPADLNEIRELQK